MRVVLIITPNAPLGENIRELMELEGYDVHVSHNIEETHQSLLQDVPQVVLCDELNLNGTFKGILKEVKSAPNNLKLILLNKDGDHSQYAHVDNSIAMPFTPEEISDKIGQAFNELD